DDIVPC
nr:Chain E, substrate peptide [synthetic construct]4JMY_F Chain F, substrate peptide [synthetic construct]